MRKYSTTQEIQIIKGAKKIHNQKTDQIKEYNKLICELI
jgi:hypothetical protein